MDIIRQHNSACENLSIELLPVYEQKHRVNNKPNGLWYGINDSWYQWLESNGYHNVPEWWKPYDYELDIDLSKICCINTEIELEEFHKKYSIPNPMMVAGDSDTDDYFSNRFRLIDWQKVSEDYSGIEISEYFGFHASFDLDYFWYYGWDVASGCIWDKNAIKGINIIALSVEKIIA